MNRKRKGDNGETMAAEYLMERGYSVLARNYRSRRGEIDLVVADGNRIVFVEVKNWDRNGVPELEQAINRTKQQRILATARLFMASHPELAASGVRFDVMLISCGMKEITHLEDAFGD